MNLYRKATLTAFFSLYLHSARAASEATGEDDEFHALLIYGSGGIATWTHNFNEALRAELGVELGQRFTPEFLSLISASQQDQALIADSLALKYSNQSIDLVIGVLTQANTFVKEFGHVFAPDAAVLHVLPGTNILGDPDLPANTTIVASAFDTATASTIALVKELFPNTEQLYIVGGAGAGDTSYLNRYREVASGIESDLRFEYLTGLPPEELLAELARAPRNSAIVMTTYDVDRSGQLLQSHRITELMASNLDIPIFGMTDTHPPVGALGGNITTTAAYARATSDVISEMMAGRIPAQPVSAGTEYLFNGQQLDRFSVNRSKLPPGSIIINDTSNLLRDYPGWIALGGGIILAQLALIALMLEARRRSRIAEAALRRTHKMEALGTLAGGIAHDFNNILMSIMANTELATQYSQGNAKAESRLDHVISACERAKSLVNQILMFSRQSHKSEWQAIDPAALLQESRELINAFIPASCRLELHCEAGLPLIMGDESQLHQILMNLCVNAQHAISEDGVIKLSAETRHLEETSASGSAAVPPGDYVCISVSDNGSGIAPENLQHVFEPFFTTKPQGKGTGLGLSLVYQIVKSHGGYIQVDSVVAKGTTIDIYLPLVSDDNTVASPVIRRKVIPKGKQERILLVDDDEMVLDSNTQIMEHLGYSVTPFSNSMAAFNAYIADPEKFDLIFSDLSMPEMDGVRLINSAREYNPDIPAIICSGYTASLNSTNMENVTILRKPSTAAEIATCIRTALTRN